MNFKKQQPYVAVFFILLLYAVPCKNTIPFLNNLLYTKTTRDV